ncbi:DUF6281 family protein [Streptomyces sp. NRRL S-37]|uniref:DUF6281 family protein n=1 Tax=Streptomyces sp. NRRL S-37 TaxID=1463903 RepID=UPI000B22800B|nr:DUF6281 family protein [Streptomyces sp. NRRL S-37]
MGTVTSTGRSALVGMWMAVTVVMSAGCASPGGGGSEASCAFRVEYDGRLYADVSRAEFTTGGKLGPAVLPPCDDSPGDGDGQAPPESTTAYAVEGVDPAVAIAVDDAPDGVLFVVDSGDDLPPEVKKLIRDS